MPPRCALLVYVAVLIGVLVSGLGCVAYRAGVLEISSNVAFRSVLIRGIALGLGIILLTSALTSLCFRKWRELQAK